MNALNLFAWLSMHLPFACETIICDKTWGITFRKTTEKRQDSVMPPQCKHSKMREPAHSFLPCLPGINFKDQRWLPPLLQGRSIKHQGEDGAMAEGDHCTRQGQTESLPHADPIQLTLLTFFSTVTRFQTVTISSCTEWMNQKFTHNA